MNVNMALRGRHVIPLVGKHVLSDTKCTTWRKSLYRNFSAVTSHRKDEKNFPKRVFSGIQPTGVPHIGNYLGAMKQWVELQDKYDDVIFSIVDLHSITVSQQPSQLRSNILDMTACMLACGLDPKKSIIFQQSTVGEHAQLSWILGCLTTLPRIQHLPQWKQKSEENTEVGLGLFTYPVLQTADILLYKATDVPVGDDQLKHIELARHLAQKFNTTYGTFFPKPNPLLGEVTKIKSLRNPAVKMSKSDKDQKSRINLTDSPEEIVKKVKKSVTDFTSTLTFEPENRPGVTNLLNIHSCLINSTPEEICEESSLMDKLTYKLHLADIIIEKLAPIKDEIVRLQNDPAFLLQVLHDGKLQAEGIAVENFEQVKKLVGFS